MLQGFLFLPLKSVNLAIKVSIMIITNGRKDFSRTIKTISTFFQDACVTIVELERHGAIMMNFRVFRCYKTNFIDISNRMEVTVGVNTSIYVITDFVY